MIVGGQIKLSQIFDHNFDRNTDRLYQPLRMAIESSPRAPSTASELQHSMQSASALQRAEMKCSRINISKAEQNLIKQSTFIPINQKLIQTNNPQKRIRARSRSYRTLSVEQRIGAPMADQLFKESMTNAGKKIEIVYDYATNNNSGLRVLNKQVDYYAAFTPSTLTKTRSATIVGLSDGFLNGMERAQTRIVNIQRKPSTHSSTSIHLQEANKKASSRKANGQAGEYYEDCKQYSFKDELKSPHPQKSLNRLGSPQQKTLVKSMSPQQNDYKYNLFNLLDEPLNTKCSTGFCHKNEIVASRIKKRW